MSEFAISVLMPTKPDRAAMFQEALASVHAQTLPDDQYEIVSRCSSVWYSEKVNDLARSARGQRVIMLADDDRLRPTCLATMLAKAQETGAHVVSANVQTFSAAGPGATFRPDPAPWTFNRFRGGPPIWITSLIDRAKFLEAGGLNFTALQYADWALWYELWKLGVTTAHIDEVLWDYRDHAGQASRSIDAHACRAAFFAAYPELFP
jgi:hypothetical protein